MTTSVPVIVIRPQPGCAATVAAAQAIDLDAHGFALFRIEPRAWDAPLTRTFDAVLLGSANALRCAGPALGNYRGMPAYVVGAETARAAEDAGLTVVATGSGGLQQVLGELAPEHTRLLRLAGETRVSLDPPPGVIIEERVVYASEPLPIPPELAAILSGGALVLLHSAEAARHFSGECARQQIDRSLLTLAALAPRIAAAAGDGWAALRVADSPSDPALLALAADLCQIVPDLRGMAKTPPMEEDLLFHQRVAPRRSGSGRSAVLIAFVAFLLGIGFAALLVWHGDLDLLVRHGAGTEQASAFAPQTGTLETRLALLEDRISRINTEAGAAEGNAARAEAMLIGLAARRAVDRGLPLGVISDQLRLRFGDAQPHSVDTVIAFAAKPVTLDQLEARLDALTPELSDAPQSVPALTRVQRELENLFTIHRDASPAVRPQDRLSRVKTMLGSGQIADAVDQVSRLPGAAAASSWIDDAKRYADVQQALDLIDTAALFDPHLHDDTGRAVGQPNAPQPVPSAAAT